MSTLDYPKDNLKILGNLFKHYRIKRGYSLRGAARSVNVSHTVISDIENCKICPNVNTLQMLYRTVGLTLEISPETIRERKAVLQRLYDAIYFQRNDSIDALFSEMKKHTHSYLFSPLRVEYMLATDAYRTVMGKRNAGRVLTDLEHFYDSLSTFQKQTLNTVKGIAFFLERRYTDALNSLKEAVSFHSSKKVEAVALSYLAYTYDALYLFHRSLHTSKEAAKAHSRLMSPIRKIHVDLLTVKSLIDLKKLEEAEKHLQSLGQVVHQPEYNTINTKDNFSILRAYLAFVQRRFTDTYEHLGKIPVSSALLLFAKAGVAYYMKDNERLREHIEELESISSDNAAYYKAAGALLQDAAGIEQDAKTLESAANTMLKGQHDSKNIYIHYLLYKLMLGYFESHKKTNKALEVMKKHFAFTHRRDLDVTLL